MLPVPSFAAYWLAESVRLREAHWGPLEDAAEVRRARARAHGFPERILLRAQYVGQREKFDLLIRRWARGARIALGALLLIAVLAGIGAALGALGNGARSVNLLLALVAILGLHILTCIAWLASFGVKGHGAWLGRSWLWLAQKFARGPDAALVPHALVELLGRNGALRWALGGISHGLWTGAFVSLLLTLLVVLSTRRYEFNWETTLLSADAFVRLTTFIGWLPQKLGFAMPSAAMVRLSDGLHTLPESVYALWSSWLIGCIVVYGLLPRVLGLLFCLGMLRRRVKALSIDTSLPAYADLRDRLQPRSEKIDIDAPAAADFQSAIRHDGSGHYVPGGPLMVGIELPADEPWPPPAFAGKVQDLGNIDTGEQRQRLLDQLQEQPPRKLLIVCDSRQTPDRGTIALLVDLASIGRDTRVALIGSTSGRSGSRMAAWKERLIAAGFAADQIHDQPEFALGWLDQTEAGEQSE